MPVKLTYLFLIALEALRHNRSRSLLTALGIIFGVASVIAMMAIGRGAQREVLEQMKMVGVNNLILLPAEEQAAGGKDSAGGHERALMNRSRGLCLSDAVALSRILPRGTVVCPEISRVMRVMANGRCATLPVHGVSVDWFRLFHIRLSNGRFFTPAQAYAGDDVCVIGSGVKAALFPGVEATGRPVRCGNTWLRIAGVLEAPAQQMAGLGNMGITDFHATVFVPVLTMQRRLGVAGPEGALVRDDWGRFSMPAYSRLINRLDKIIIRVAETDQVRATDSVLRRVMLRLHNGEKDFRVAVPELILQQEKRTRSLFNIVLGLIAGISLLVGGIGIMNVMMTSVVERTKEIGVRLALGATRKDIIIQFLAESAMVSLAGGLAGIVAGIVLTLAIRFLAGIPVHITFFSVLLAFVISVGVGILFGYLPARHAARQDPVMSLRYE